MSATDPGSAANVVQITGLTRRFGSKIALDGVNLTMPRGCVFGLVGPNGAGKTTLIKSHFLRIAACGVAVHSNQLNLKMAGVPGNRAPFCSVRRRLPRIGFTLDATVAAVEVRGSVNSTKGGASMKLLMLVLLAALTQPGSDPQKLFLAMEEKITNATSVQITFDAKMESNKDNLSGKGTLTFAPKGKARADLTLDGKGNKMKILMVSDGTKMYSRMDEKDAMVDSTPEFLSKSLLVIAAKTGIMAGWLFVVRTESSDGKGEIDAFAGLKITDFKLGKIEMVGGKDAQIVEYRLDIPGSKLKFEAMVWIDVKTTLPVKRQLVAKMGGERLTLTENYSEFRLNAKLDAKFFELPK